MDLDRVSLFTRREAEILSLIAKGKSSKEIAGQLLISLNTVSNHRKHILPNRPDNDSEAKAVTSLGRSVLRADLRSFGVIRVPAIIAVDRSGHSEKRDHYRAQ